MCPKHLKTNPGLFWPTSGAVGRVWSGCGPQVVHEWWTWLKQHITTRGHLWPFWLTHGIATAYLRPSSGKQQWTGQVPSFHEACGLDDSGTVWATSGPKAFSYVGINEPFTCWDSSLDPFCLIYFTIRTLPSTEWNSASYAFIFFPHLICLSFSLTHFESQ